MTDLTFVKNASVAASSQNPLSSDHPLQAQIDKIVSLIEQEKIDEASSLIEKIFTKGVLDIRLVAYYGYAHFVNHGIASFFEIFPLLIQTIQEHWENIKPANRKDKQVQNSLNWLILHLITKLKQLEKLFKKGEVHSLWSLSTVDITLEQLDHAMQKLEDFKIFFRERWPQSTTEERIMHLLQMIKDIRDFKEIEIQEKENRIVESEIAEPVDEVLQEELPLSKEIEEVESSLEEIDKCVEETLQQSERLTSDRMEHLVEKMKLFERLIVKNDFLKAALVAKDIDEMIENFNPLDYFPHFFSNYFSQVARNVPSLAEYTQNANVQQMKYLENLYKTDLDLFIQW